MNTVIERKAEPMKFVLNGRTFDTATAETLAVQRGTYDPQSNDMAWEGFPGAEQVRYENVLYATPKGALFVHYHSTAKYRSGKPVTEDSAEELDREKAVKWITKTKAAIINDALLPLPPEA